MLDHRGGSAGGTSSGGHDLHLAGGLLGGGHRVGGSCRLDASGVSLGAWIIFSLLKSGKY